MQQQKFQPLQSCVWLGYRAGEWEEGRDLKVKVMNKKKKRIRLCPASLIILTFHEKARHCYEQHEPWKSGRKSTLQNIGTRTSKAICPSQAASRIQISSGQLSIHFLAEM